MGSGAARVVDSQLSPATKPTTASPSAPARSLRPNRAGTAQNVITGSLTANGSPFVLTIPNAGDTGSITFSGTADERVSLNIYSDSILYALVSFSGPGTTWNETIHGGHFFLQEEWSNADSSCEPRAKPDALIMHPGPMNRGVEIASTIADHSRSVIRDQVEMGVAVRMAVLEAMGRQLPNH